MNNLLHFKNGSNLELLWEVLLDELNINKTNTNVMKNIRTIFESNITLFLINGNPKSSIIDLNKQFLSQVVIAVNKLIPELKRVKRINILDEPINAPYKIEDIQMSRQSEFEKELEQKKLELENYLTPQKPKDMDFTDKLDGKIQSMDQLIAEKMAQRNAEIETLNYTYVAESEEWLKSKETKPQLVIQEKSKKVSWNDQESASTLNIFSKLKKQLPVIENENENEIRHTNNYDAQPSITLNDIKENTNTTTNMNTNTNANTNSNTNSNTNISYQEPVLPKSEIIKQLNEMNKKIDALYELVYKLTCPTTLT